MIVSCILSLFILEAILINIRETIRSTSWDETVDPVAEVNKLVMPILASSLDYDLQKAAEEAVRVATCEVCCDQSIARRCCKPLPEGRNYWRGIFNDDALNVF